MGELYKTCHSNGSISATRTEEANSIKIDTNETSTGYGYIAFSVTSNINLSNYSKVHFEFEDGSSSPTTNGFWIFVTSSKVNGITYTDPPISNAINITSYANDNIYKNFTIDVSNVNQGYLGIAFRTNGQHAFEISKIYLT